MKNLFILAFMLMGMMTFGSNANLPNSSIEKSELTTADFIVSDFDNVQVEIIDYTNLSHAISCSVKVTVNVTITVDDFSYEYEATFTFHADDCIEAGRAAGAAVAQFVNDVVRRPR